MLCVDMCLITLKNNELNYLLRYFVFWRVLCINIDAAHDYYCLRL